jgi:uncharacterized membrane protein
MLPEAPTMSGNGFEEVWMNGWRKAPEWQWVLGLAIIFWVVCNALVLHRYYSFYSSYANYNQGIFAQLFWNSLHGRFFESSLSSALSSAVVHGGELPDVSYQRLGQHFTPSLMLWLPVYALYSSPAGLSVLQTTLMAIAGLVLYALARQYHPPHLSAMIAASYYGAIAVISPTLADFRDFSQLSLFVFGALLALERRLWWVFWPLILLTLLIREDAGIVLFGIGVFLVLTRHLPHEPGFMRKNHSLAWVGGIVCVLSLGYILVVTNVVMPFFSDDISRRFMIEQFGQFVGSDEASTLDVLWAIAGNPGLLITELVTPVDRTVEYLLAQWLPLAFVSALSPATWVLTSFPLLKLLIRQAPDALSLSLRYAWTMVPGLFYGAILWWAVHRERFQPRIRRFWVLCIGLSLVITIATNPNRALSFMIPDSFQPLVYVSPVRQWQHAGAIRSILRQVPEDAGVSATEHIAGHLSNRRELLLFPMIQLRNDDHQIVWLDYAVVDLWGFEQYQAVFDDDRDRLRRAIRSLQRLINQENYGLIDYQDGVVLLQRDRPSNPEAVNQLRSYRQQLLEF